MITGDPPFLRTRQMIVVLVNICGGISKGEEVFGKECWLKEFCFKADDCGDGFILTMYYMNHEEFFFPMRLVVGQRYLAETSFEELMVLWAPKFLFLVC